MGNERKFYIDKAYLLEIKDAEGTFWNWEINVAVSGYEYKGMAIERQKNEVIPWVTLTTDLYEEEIENLCRQRIEK